MFKRSIIILLLINFFIPSIKVKASDTLLQNAKSGLLMEVSTGKIIYEKNIHEKVSVASRYEILCKILLVK